VLPRIAQKLHQAKRCQPLGIVSHARRVRALEGQESLKLCTDPPRVLRHLLRSLQLPLSGLSARISDHPGAAAHEGDRAMPVPLQVDEDHDRHQAADVKAASRRVESDVRRDRPRREQLGYAIRLLMHEPAPA